jgi:PHD/YefM family antitoxin component YafN of YafNO toxin-antitoxin module
MKKIKTKFIYDEKNKKVGVLLPVQDFEFIMDEYEDYYDYLLAKKLEPIDLKKTKTLEEFKKELFGK